MVYLTSLWLPIVLSAVAVFLASSILHMVLTYHKNDYSTMPGQDNVRAAMRKEGVGPGYYYLPHFVDSKHLTSSDLKKFEEGPVAYVTVLPNGVPSVARSLVAWFVYCLVIAALVAYLTGRTVAPGAEYLTVFRVAGTAALLGFAGAHASASIWRGQLWSITAKHLLDGLVYSLVTAGVFGWLWPN